LLQIIQRSREFKIVQIKGQILIKGEIIKKGKNRMGSLKNLMNHKARKAQIYTIIRASWAQIRKKDIKSNVHP
jgi:hypothetical protein